MKKKIIQLLEPKRCWMLDKKPYFFHPAFRINQEAA
jgi:hypothetical protein